MIEDKIEIKLNGATYEAKLDMGAIAEVQYYFKNRKNYMKITEIFDGVFKDDLSIIDELIIQSIRRFHKQFSREDILSNLKISELSEIRSYCTKLISVSLPSSDEKKTNI